MDQQHWDSEDGEDGQDSYESDRMGDTGTSPDTFYLALKLALARLKEYASATTG